MRVTVKTEAELVLDCQPHDEPVVGLERYNGVYRLILQSAEDANSVCIVAVTTVDMARSLEAAAKAVGDFLLEEERKQRAG